MLKWSGAEPVIDQTSVRSSVLTARAQVKQSAASAAQRTTMFDVSFHLLLFARRA
jgi:hypothetical protein